MLKLIKISAEATYRSWDDKSREEIPKCVEESGDNSGNVVIWSDSHSHHTVEDEVG